MTPRLRRLSQAEMGKAAAIHQTSFDARLPWLVGLHTPTEDIALFKILCSPNEISKGVEIMCQKNRKLLAIVMMLITSCERGPQYLYFKEIDTAVACFGPPAFALPAVGPIDECMQSCLDAGFAFLNNAEGQRVRLQVSNKISGGYQVPAVCREKPSNRSNTGVL